MPIQCNRLSLSFRDLKVFDNFSLDIPDRHVTAILGPSGCGKTTLLNLISGLLGPDSGSVSGVQGERISYLFQEPRLLPWKSVRKNIELVLTAHFTAGELAERSSSFLDMVGLSRFADYYPHELSGGMRQRAAVARAFAYPAGVMLMDEPFQALDLHLKLALIELFERLWCRDKRTALFVTHDIQEAVLLGDSIVVLYGPPAEIQASIHNPIPREQRSLKEHTILELEQQLYTLLS
ncbi:MAG: ABC transporter ATP-binding protein [Spirochaetota bacterium]